MPRKPTLENTLPPLDKHLCFALYATSLAMTKLYKPLLTKLRLTYPQYLVMLALWESGEHTVSELGARLQLDSGTLTPLLKRLEQIGYITRTRSADDERRVTVKPSLSGKRLRTKAQTLPACILQATECSLQDIDALTTQLHALRARLLNSTIPNPL